MSDDRTPRPSDYVCAECGRAVPENAPCPHCSSPTPESMERAMHDLLSYPARMCPQHAPGNGMLCRDCAEQHVARLLDELAEAKASTRSWRGEARAATDILSHVRKLVTPHCIEEFAGSIGIVEVVRNVVGRIAALEAERDKLKHVVDQCGPEITKLTMARDQLLAAVEWAIETGPQRTTWEMELRRRGKGKT